jgi:WD40 repeat protein
MKDIKKDSTVPKEKSSKKKWVLIGIISFLLLLIIVFIIARPEILKGNFELDYLLFRKSPEVVEEEETTAKEDSTIEEQTEPMLVWSVNTAENEVNTGILSLAISPDEETVAIGEYLTTHIYHLSDGSLEQILMYEHSVEDLDYSNDGTILAGGQGVYGALLLDVEDGEEIYQLGQANNNKVSFSPDGKYIATGDRTGDVWIWDLNDGTKLTTLQVPDAEYAASIEYDPSGNFLATTNWNGNVYIFDVDKEELLETINLDILTGEKSHSFRFSPDGEVMAGYLKEDNEYFVRLWDVENFKQIQDIATPKNVRDISFSPDGQLMSTSSGSLITVRDSESAINIFDVQSGNLLYTIERDSENEEFSLEELGGKVRPVVSEFTSDGKHIAIAWNDSTLELWRLPGGESIAAKPKDIKNPPPLPGDVLFDANEAVLKESANDELEKFAQELSSEFENVKITFIGHTTSYADADFNMKLSSDRASSVKEWFEQWAQNNDITGWEFSSEGKGSSDLYVPDRDSEGNFIESAGALNRRVEILIEAL